MFVPSKAFGIMLGASCFDLVEKQKLYEPATEFKKTQKRDKILKFLHKIDIQISHVVLIFLNFWSYRSIRSFQIATNCSIFDRFCFLCVVCLFWWFYGFLWRVFSIEKLEYSRYHARIIYEWVATVLIVVICFLILTDLTKVLLSFVWVKFSSFRWLYDGWRNKD